MQLLQILVVITLTNCLMAHGINDDNWVKLHTDMSSPKVQSIGDLIQANPGVTVEGVFVLAGWIALDWKFEEELALTLVMKNDRSVIGHVKVANNSRITNDKELKEHLESKLVKDNYSMLKGKKIYWWKGGALQVMDWP